MHTVLTLGIAVTVVTYMAMQLLLHTTQSPNEPHLLEAKLPFLQPALDILKHRASYLAHLR